MHVEQTHVRALDDVEVLSVEVLQHDGARTLLHDHGLEAHAPERGPRRAGDVDRAGDDHRRERVADDVEPPVQHEARVDAVVNEHAVARARGIDRRLDVVEVRVRRVVVVDDPRPAV
jgi:hypothetical protein